MPRENGRVIGLLQRLGLLQSTRAHAKHHTDPKDCSYCTVTNFLNPILDRIELWGRLERVLHRVCGVTRRIDESVRVDRKDKAKAAAGCRCSSGGDCSNCVKKRNAKREVELAS